MNNTTGTVQEYIQTIEALSVGDYSTPLSFAKIIYDRSLLDSIEGVYQSLQGRTVTDVVLVGIGGSHFGVQAVYDALYGHKDVKPIRFHTFTSIDTFALDDVVTRYVGLLQDVSAHVVTFIVSKTGTTFETASQASLCFELLKKYKLDTYRTHLCVVTDEDSLLYHAAGKEGLELIAIPKNIGGRYSVFSAAGLVVLRFLGVSLVDLLAGAQSVDLRAPLQTASVLFDAFNDGYLVHDTFIFMPYYASVGGWTRQLIGESLGKGRKGFLPTVSLGSQDLHSVIQQYFGGKQITMTSFLIPAEYDDQTSVPDTLFSRVGNLRPGLFFSDIQRSIIQAVQESYLQAEKPFFTFGFRKGSAFDIGHYMQYKMLETVYLGALMGVNPFDQPQVELYKKETRVLLS